jgi:hypothetical protein
VAIAAAHQRLGLRDSLRAFEQMEWTQARVESWLLQQVYEGKLRAVECANGADTASLYGKLAVAQLAESALTRVCRVIGVARMHKRHRSAAGLRMSAHWDFCAHPGPWPMTNCWK